jgi:hypothetical protein
MMDCPKCGKLCGSDEFGVHINECVSPDTHTIGSHSDDRGGESDYPCYCDTPVSPNTNIEDINALIPGLMLSQQQKVLALLSAPKIKAYEKAIERILVKHHLPEKAPGEKLWGEYIAVVLDLEALLSVAKIQAYDKAIEDAITRTMGINDVAVARERIKRLQTKKEK